MAAEVKWEATGCPVASSPLDRDPRKFPFGVLLVAPGIFEAISGFAWFVSEAEAVEYLHYGVWPAIDLDDGRKQACMQMFGAVLAGGDGLSQGVVDKLGQVQDELIVPWAGTFEGILNGSEDFVLELLASTAEQVGNPELLGSPDGLQRLMAEYRWQFTGGADGLRVGCGSLSEEGRRRFLSGLQSATQD